MKIPKINIWVIVALAAIVAIAYFTYEAVQQESYSGSELSFTTSGVISLDNLSEGGLTLTAVSNRTFTLNTNVPDQNSLRATREGSGRNAQYVLEAEFDTTNLELNVARGSNVEFTITNVEGESMDATVAARSAEQNRNMVLGAVGVCLALLVFISFQTEHTLLKSLFAQLPFAKRNAVEAAPA